VHNQQYIPLPCLAKLKGGKKKRTIIVRGKKGALEKAASTVSVIGSVL
jgi:hypothetical protein